MSELAVPSEPSASVVIAVLNEAETIGPVCREVFAAMAPDIDFEVVIVDDGSTDATAALVTEMMAEDSRLRLVRHATRCGKSQAVRTGVLAARGDWIATLDGDGQNDPADLSDMLRAAWNHPGPAPALVAGIRTRREDPLSRRIATRIANRIRRMALGDHCPDTGCGMKVFRRDRFLLLPCFEGMHRFLPALFQRYGSPLINHPVRHRPRLAGQSKYTNLGRAVVGIFDTIGVFWLIRRTRAPQMLAD